MDFVKEMGETAKWLLKGAIDKLDEEKRLIAKRDKLKAQKERRDMINGLRAEIEKLEKEEGEKKK